jgi:hypothetical protein
MDKVKNKKLLRLREKVVLKERNIVIDEGEGEN